MASESSGKGEREGGGSTSIYEGEEEWGLYRDGEGIEAFMTRSPGDSEAVICLAIKKKEKNPF